MNECSGDNGSSGGDGDGDGDVSINNDDVSVLAVTQILSLQCFFHVFILIHLRNGHFFPLFLPSLYR